MDRSSYTKDELSLCEAVASNNIQLVTELLNRGTRTDLYDEDGFCLLLVCAQSTRGTNPITYDMLSLLLTKCDPNQANYHDGENALQYAVLCGTPQMVQILLNAGADPDRKDSLGSCARDFAK